MSDETKKGRKKTGLVEDRTSSGWMIRPTRRGLLLGAGAVAAASAFRINPVGYARAQAAGTVTIYSSMPSEFLDMMAQKFNSQNNGVTLQTFFAPTYQAYERVNAELSANRLNADLVLLADPGPFLELKAKDELLSYDSEVYSRYPAGHFDADQMWVNGRSIATMMTVHKDVARPPVSWQDFADKRWEGKTGMIDVRVGGTAYNWYYTLRQLYPKDYWKDVAALKPVLQRGHGQLMDQLVTKQLDITEQLCYYAYSSVKERQAPIVPIYASDIVPLTMAPIAILKRAPNVEAAKVVFDWWLSKEGQEYLQETNGVYSVRDDVAPLEGKPPYAELKTIEYDLDEYSARREEYQAEFIEIFDL